MVRKLIQARLDELGMKRKELSLAIGKDAGYISQFLVRGVPAELLEPERMKIAEILKVPEEKLRGPSLPLPKRPYVKQQDATRESLVDTKSPQAHGERGAPHHEPQIIPGAKLYANGELRVYGTLPGNDGSLIISSRPVEHVTRPSVLLRVEDGFGLIVYDDVMRHALKAGSTALIHPHLPPRHEDLCLFRSRAEDGSERVIIREYRSQTESHWRLRELNPVRDYALKRSDWQYGGRVVGSYFA